MVLGMDFGVVLEEWREGWTVLGNNPDYPPAPTRGEPLRFWGFGGVVRLWGMVYSSIEIRGMNERKRV